MEIDKGNGMLKIVLRLGVILGRCPPWRARNLRHNAKVLNGRAKRTKRGRPKVEEEA